MPAISIIVPVYNVEAYIGQCLESLLAQTFRDFEIVCINDGSTDGTLDVLNKYAGEDPRIKVFSQANSGLSGARNRGLKEAVGEFILFVDGDDWIDEETCAVLFGAIQKENADCVMCAYVREFENKTAVSHIFDENYMVLQKDEIKYSVHRRIVGLVGEELKRPETCELVVSVCMQLFRRQSIEGLSFTDTKRIGSGDILFQMYAYAGFDRFVYIDKPFYHYRRTNITSNTTRHRPDLFEKWENLYSLMETFIAQKRDEPVFHKALQNRIVFGLIGLGFNEISAQKTLIQKARRLKEILRCDRYKKAFRQFEYHYLPLHWYVFFRLCWYKRTLIVVLLLQIINHLRLKGRAS